MLRWLLRLGTHAVALAIGFALGVYFLPILTAPPGPDRAAIEAASEGATFTGTFRRDLKGSNFLHWGEGEIRLMADRIVHDGRLSPGPDYKLYLVSDFVEDEAGFLAVKGQGRSHRRREELRRLHPECAAGHRHRRLYHRCGVVRGLRPVHQRGEVQVGAGGSWSLSITGLEPVTQTFHM